MNIPTTIWCVADKNGNVSMTKTYEIAAAKARLWDLEFPCLSPHQVVCYSISLPALVAPSPYTGMPDAIPDATFSAEAP